MRITTIAATINEPKPDNDHEPQPFTVEQLQLLADTSKGALITNNFDHSRKTLGTVLSAKVEDGKLKIEADIFCDLSDGNRYIVPGYVIPEFKIISTIL